MHVRWLAWNDLSPVQLEGWRTLVSEATTPNAFCGPDWVSPSVAAGVQAPVVLWLGTDAEPDAVVALQAARPTVRVPMPHWRAFWSIHTYQSGVTARSLDVMPALARALAASPRPAVAFAMQPVDGTSDAFDEAMRGAGAQWIDWRRWQRAAILPGEDATSCESRNQRKKLRRALHRLEHLGQIEWQVVRAGPELVGATNEFLRLEHLGWKGEGGTSLQATMRREIWFREVVANFAARDDVAFTQLRAGGHVVASSVNIQAGTHVFGLKIGWDVAHAEASPGSLHEHEFVDHAAESFPGATLIDAVADPGSFVEKYWPHRRLVRTGAFAFGRAATAGLVAMRALNRART